MTPDEKRALKEKLAAKGIDLAKAGEQATEALREAFRIGPAVSYAHRVEYDRYVATVRAQLDEAAFAAAWAEGRELTLKQAIEYALSESEIPTDASTPPSAQELNEKFDGLKRRECEAAALIAQGKSNREIAETMTVGLNTAETYMTRIRK